MEMKFKKEKGYFPNIRFVVLKLLQLKNKKHNYKIPQIRTKSKLIPLNTIFDKIYIEI